MDSMINVTGTKIDKQGAEAIMEMIEKVIGHSPSELLRVRAFEFLERVVKTDIHGLNISNCTLKNVDKEIR